MSGDAVPALTTDGCRIATTVATRVALKPVENTICTSDTALAWWRERQLSGCLHRKPISHLDRDKSQFGSSAWLSVHLLWSLSSLLLLMLALQGCSNTTGSVCNLACSSSASATISLCTFLNLFATSMVYFTHRLWLIFFAQLLNRNPEHWLPLLSWYKHLLVLVMLQAFLWCCQP